MAKGSRGNGKHTGTKRSSRINHAVKPSDMSPEEWQRALRRQGAQKGVFGIQLPSIPDDPFVVRSSHSDRVYRVYYFGQRAVANQYECVDFKTGRLHTCKYLEAITLAQNGHYPQKRYQPPVNTRKYADYPAGSGLIIRPTSLKYQRLAEFRRFTYSSILVVERYILKREEQLNDYNDLSKICSFYALSTAGKSGISQSSIYQYRTNQPSSTSNQPYQLRSTYYPN